jgi:muconolactone delta-isomerase
MRFLVISTPTPAQPSEVAGARLRFWEWIKPLQDDGTVLSIHARVGRGVVVIFQVDSNETLHRLMTAWAEIIPAQMDVYPLIDPDAAKAYLQTNEGK